MVGILNPIRRGICAIQSSSKRAFKYPAAEMYALTRSVNPSAEYVQDAKLMVKVRGEVSRQAGLWFKTERKPLICSMERV